MDAKAAGKACIKVRKDGVAVDIDGDYTETLARSQSNTEGIGVFGLSFYENNTDKLKVATDQRRRRRRSRRSPPASIRCRGRCSSTSRRRTSASSRALRSTSSSSSPTR